MAVDYWEVLFYLLQSGFLLLGLVTALLCRFFSLGYFRFSELDYRAVRSIALQRGFIIRSLALIAFRLEFVLIALGSRRF